MRRLLYLPFLICFLFLGCSKLDPKIETPAYIEIDDYSVITDYPNQGTNDQKFTDVLVYSSTQNLGYYPIPSKIPIVKSGDTYLSIRPVILVNGVKFLRLDYPMMKGCDTTLPLKKGEVLKVRPVFKYFSTVTFPVKEDFENINVTLANSNPTDTVTTGIDQSNAAFGSKCYSMQLDATHATSQIQSTNGFTLSTTGGSSYLEFNYKGNFPLEAGIIGSSSPGFINTSDQRSAGGVKPSSAWKKMYLNLTDIGRSPPYNQFYFLYFYTTQSFDPSTPAPQVYIDNIKVVRQ